MRCARATAAACGATALGARSRPRSPTGAGGCTSATTPAASPRCGRATGGWSGGAPPPGGRAGALGTLQRPVKLAVRKLTRWYVEPVFADQRAVNDALVKLVDELADEVDELRARVDALESERA